MRALCMLIFVEGMVWLADMPIWINHHCFFNQVIHVRFWHWYNIFKQIKNKTKLSWFAFTNSSVFCQILYKEGIQCLCAFPGCYSQLGVWEHSHKILGKRLSMGWDKGRLHDADESHVFGHCNLGNPVQCFCFAFAQEIGWQKERRTILEYLVIWFGYRTQEGLSSLNICRSRW